MFKNDAYGFFPALFLSFCETLSEKEKADISNAPNTEKRIELMAQKDFFKEKFDKMQVISGKSLEKSQACRQEGNNYFNIGKLSQAVLKYSTAIMFAPKNEADLSLALANRSAALQKLGQFNQSLKDIDEAVRAGYPADKLFKLEERRGQCLVSLGNYKEAGMAFQSALKHSQAAKLSRDGLDKFKATIQKQMRDLTKAESSLISELTPRQADNGTANGINNGDSSDCQSGDQLIDHVSRLLEVNPHYPCLHKDVLVEYSPDKGRYTVAKNDIPVGTVILKEHPLSWTLHADRQANTCNMCMVTVNFLVPCDTCTSVVYCSQKCRDEAWTDHHYAECGFLAILHASGLNNFSYLALRGLARTGFQSLLKMRDNRQQEDLTQPDIRYGQTKDDMPVYDSSHLKAGLNLVHHTDTLDAEEVILRTMIAFFIIKGLRLTNFVPANAELTPEIEPYLASVVYTLLNACPPNSHEIDVMQTPTMDRWSAVSEIKALGVGLYPTAALFNHNCDPNIMRYNFGRDLVSVTCRTIKAGEEIFDCYGLPWYSKPKERRTDITNRFYNFKCGCQGCVENWPMSDMLAKTDFSSVCKVFCEHCGSVVDRKGLEAKLTCSSCKKEVNINNIPYHDIAQLTNQAMEELCLKKHWKEGLVTLTSLNELLGRHLPPPTWEHFITEISIWRSIWTIAGNKKVVKIL